MPPCRKWLSTLTSLRPYRMVVKATDARTGLLGADPAPTHCVPQLPHLSTGDNGRRSLNEMASACKALGSTPGWSSRVLHRAPAIIIHRSISYSQGKYNMQWREGSGEGLGGHLGQSFILATSLLCVLEQVTLACSFLISNPRKLK